MRSLRRSWRGLGYRARKGQLVDASLALAPAQRTTREENAQVKSGKVPEDREAEEARPKRRQKDMAARWTKKHGRSHYGYKNHVNVDNKHKLIRTWAVTPANVHDSQLLDELLDEDNSSKDVWADSAYRSGEQEQRLRDRKYRSHIQRKGERNKPLTRWEQQGNRTRATVRVEHVFGAQCATRTKLIRCIGLERSTLAIGMMNLVYNLRRLCYLEGVNAPCLTGNRDKRVSKRHLKAITRRDDGGVEGIDGPAHLTIYKYSNYSPPLS